MGRRLLTNEQRVEGIELAMRADLTSTFSVLTIARENEAQAERRFVDAVERALEAGVSYRDLEALLGVPRSSLNVLVKAAA